MSKKYTSSLVREAIRNAICDDYVVNVLNQFAEDLEREEGLRKRLTAQDVRAVIQTSACDAKTAKVMMRYAKYLERKKTCEKKYEYKVLYRYNGYLYDSIRHYQNIMSAQKTLGVYSGHEDAHIVRREVGEWEEVLSEEG